MRLINTSSLALEDRKNIKDEPYAILTHRWREGEVSYQDMQSRNHETREHLSGWSKLSTFCALARNKGYKYAWVDTCCINKDSSAEVSESINAMYQWYREAAVCIAFLYDVGPHGKLFEQSEWFERGWTLQELIAPNSVEFYDQNWKSIGFKVELVAELCRYTGIPKSVLLDPKKVRGCSIAQRMSWAAERTTEQAEDRAWSLLGLFGISNISLSYGIGKAAFLTLQEEIIRTHADQSIFAWKLTSEMRYAGPFAESPSAFKGCGDIKCEPGSRSVKREGLGIPINLPARPYSMNTYLCTLSAYRNRTWCAILLIKIPGTEHYVRTQNSKEQSQFAIPNQQNFKSRDFIIAFGVPEEIPLTYYGFWLRNIKPPGIASSRVETLSNDGKHNLERISLQESNYGTAGMLSIVRADGSSSKGWSRVRWVKLGFNDDFEPVCLLANHRSRQGPVPLDFSKALAPDADPHLRSSLLDRPWIQEDLSAGAFPTIAAGWVGGHYQQSFPGDGGALKLEALNLVLSINLVLDPDIRTNSQSSQQEPHRVWVVDILDTGGSSPETQHCCSDIEYLFQWTAGALCAMIGCPCMLNEVHGERMQTHGYHCCCAF